MKQSLLLIITLFLISPVNGLEIVSTSSGDVIGVMKKKVILYEDIPFAEPPVGNLRWKAPRSIQEKREIYPKENNFCIQRPSNLGGINGDNFFVGSEDCLYLDIFVPKKK